MLCEAMRQNRIERGQKSFCETRLSSGGIDSALQSANEINQE
jgi:hypothetical protein